MMLNSILNQQRRYPKGSFWFLFISISIFFSCNTQHGIAQLDAKEKIDKPILFPRPFALAIDDIGWNDGINTGATTEGPYRIGLKRKMELSDYQCIVDVAKKTGVRFQGLFIMGEMDRENILATVPSTNEYGAKWDNSANINDEQIKIMEFVKNNSAWLEFGLHGVGHEHWPDGRGKRKRAEWYNTDDNEPWAEAEIEKHIDIFKKLMAQYGLTRENGHSFPESFVPCAYGYHWNPGGDYSTGAKLRPEGVKYANTLFTYVEELNPPQGENNGGIDHGQLVVNRINYGNHWYKLAALPTVPLEDQKSDVIETHWTNWLAQDDFLQEALNQEWIDYIFNVTTVKDRYVTKNTEQFYAQWLYKKYATITRKGINQIIIDNTLMPEEVYQANLLSNLVLKVKLAPGEHVSAVKLDNQNLQVYYEEGGYGMIIIPILERKKYQLTYEVSNNEMPTYLLVNGTYNVYHFETTEKKAMLKLRMYGTQSIDIIGIPEPKNLKSFNPHLSIKKTSYNEESKILTLTLTGRNIQGETGVITWSY